MPHAEARQAKPRGPLEWLLIGVVVFYAAVLLVGPLAAIFHRC